MYRPISEYYELPNKYNETVVRLLVQSPTRMYAYWEVSDGAIKNFDNQKIDYNLSTPILKITNLTMNYSYEVKIDPYATNYWIDVKDVNCNYKVELGRRYKNKYISIYESNQVTIPRSAPVFQKESEEIVYRNYIRLEKTEKFVIYTAKKKEFNANNKQEYYGLSFGPEDSISSESRYKQS